MKKTLVCCGGVLAVALGALTLLPTTSSAAPVEETPQKNDTRPGAVPIEAHLIDGSRIKMTLREDKVEITTRYGKLVVPVADIQRMEFATRISEEMQRRVDAAIGKLGSEDPATREAGSSELYDLREVSYPSLLEAAKSKDPEVVRRAEELITRIREKVPEQRLWVRKADVICTDGMVLTGRIIGESLRVNTVAFGDQQVKLSSLVALGETATTMPEAINAMPDPGSVYKYSTEVGKTFAFTVTGNPTGSVWGSDVYTTDSTLATAAVHAGVVAPNQTKVVKVMILVSPATFLGTSRNGIETRPYGPFTAAFQFVK